MHHNLPYDFIGLAAASGTRTSSDPGFREPSLLLSDITVMPSQAKELRVDFSYLRFIASLGSETDTFYSNWGFSLL